MYLGLAMMTREPARCRALANGISSPPVLSKYDESDLVFLQIGDGVFEAFGVVGFGFGLVFAVYADDEMAFGDVDAGVVWCTHHEPCIRLLLATVRLC